MTPSVDHSPSPIDLTMELHRRLETQLQRHEYPDVKFWYRHEWTGHMKIDKGVTNLGNTAGQPEDGSDDDDAGDDDTIEDRANTGKAGSKIKTIPMCYITDATGNIIQPWRAADIRHAAAESWLELLEHRELKAPTSWKRVMPEARRYYIHKLETTCPEVGLCANHWKAEEIAIRHYPNFFKKFTKEINAQFPPDTIDASNAGKRRTHSLTRLRSPSGQKRQRQNGPVLRNPL